MRPLLLLALLTTGALAQKIPTGPTVGAAVPSFAAPDQNSRTQSLSTIAGPKGALLVFYRSADW
jgi:hypothetical protein